MGAAAPGLRTRLTAYVHPYLNARVMLVELRGENAMNARLRWYTSLRLNERPDGQVTTVFSAEKRVIYAQNGANRLYAPYSFAFTSQPAPERFTCDGRTTAAACCGIRRARDCCRALRRRSLWSTRAMCTGR